MALYHGTLISAGAETFREGLKVRLHEATLTEDLATAVLIYGTHSGHPRALSLTSAEGYVVWVTPGDWIPLTSPTTAVWVNPRSRLIQGGVTKWIGGYMTLYARNHASSHQKFRDKFKNGTLRLDPEWRAERRLHLSVSAGEFHGPTRVDASILEWAHGLDAQLSCRTLEGTAGSLTHPSFQVDRSDALWVRSKRWTRRLALSILRNDGYEVVATDTYPWRLVPASVLLDLTEVQVRLGSLGEFACRFSEPRVGRCVELLRLLQKVTASRGQKTSDVLAELELHTEPEVPQGG